jgi:hypothetical protein
MSAVEPQRRISSWRFAPKSWDMAMPVPLARPKDMARNTKVREAQLPTAASAASDTNWPTTMPSTVL